MRNRSKTKEYKISVILRVDVVTYTGKVGDAVKNEHFNVIVKPDSTHEIKLSVRYDEYGKRVIDQCAFKVSCLASIEDSKFEYYAQDDFRLVLLKFNQDKIVKVLNLGSENLISR